MPVTGDAGCLVHNGLAHSHQAVEKGAFSYVRSPDYRYKGHNNYILGCKDTQFFVKDGTFYAEETKYAVIDIVLAHLRQVFILQGLIR